MNVSALVEAFKAEHPDAFQAIHDTGFEAGKAKATADTAPTAEAFIAAFGDIGARWFCEKKSFAQASTDFLVSLKADHAKAIETLAAQHKTALDAETAKVTDLQAKLDAMPRGNDAAAFDAEPGKGAVDAKQVQHLEQKLGSNGLAKFAAGIKFAPAAGGVLSVPAK